MSPGYASRPEGRRDQGNFTIGDGLLGKVVIHDEGMTARVAEVLADGGAGERRIVLQGGRVRGGGGDDDGVVHGGRIRGGGGHDDGVVHRAVVAEGLDDAGYGGALLADGHIDAVDRIPFQEIVPLVDDGVDRQGSLAGLAVADDELTLAAADRNHRVDGLEARLQRLVHGLAVDDARRLALQGHVHLLPADVAQAVQRIA